MKSDFATNNTARRSRNQRELSTDDTDGTDEEKQ
jgi:hypothetical protein